MRNPARPALLAALLLFLGATALSACVITSGPNCADACDKAVECEDLDKTFALNCAPYGACYGVFAECAQCILDTNCKRLVAGLCDSVCVPAP